MENFSVKLLNVLALWRNYLFFEGLGRPIDFGISRLTPIYKT